MAVARKPRQDQPLNEVPLTGIVFGLVPWVFKQQIGLFVLVVMPPKEPRQEQPLCKAPWMVIVFTLVPWAVQQ